MSFREPLGKFGRLGVALLVGVTILSAPLSRLSGRGWEHVLAFGWGPDQTALGTLGLVTTIKERRAALILAVPALLWVLVAELTEIGLR